MNILKFKSSRSVKRAFTLIEIMVATVIMVVLVGLVIQITSEVLNVWNRSSGKLAANAEARIAMDLVTQDLETAVFRKNGQQWLRVEAPAATNGPYQDNTVSLKLFSSAADRDRTAGDGICGIAYRLAFKESYQNGEDVYALYRFIETPENTFNNLLGSTSLIGAGPQGELIGGAWNNANITNDDNYLVSNIVEFKILIYEDDGTLNPAPVNGNADGQVNRDYAYGGVNGSTQPLLYADIRMTVVSDEGLEILKLPSLAGTGYTNYTDVVLEHGEVFTRRVTFMAKPL